MPFSEFLDIIQPILDLYDEGDFESAAILARKEYSFTTNTTLKVLLQSLVYHLEGNSRWESSYDYTMARGLLKQADDVISQNIDLCSELEKRGLTCLQALNGAVEAAINLENALISVDTRAMTQIATDLESIASKGLALVAELEPDEDGLASWFQSQLSSWKVYGTGVTSYASAMTSLRGKDFPKIFAKAERVILECLAKIEEEEDEDSYTELASYLEFLRYHRALIERQKEYLVLKENSLTWLFSFWGEQDLLNAVYDNLLQDASLFTEQLSELGITIDTIDEDSLSDLFETVLGISRMKDLVIRLQPLKLNFRGEDIDIQMSVRIFRYGVCTIYLEGKADELTASDLRVYLSFSGPHSAEFDITWEGRTYTRLSAVAEEIVTKLNEVMPQIAPGLALRFVPHLNWYGYVLVKRGIWSRGGPEDRLLTLQEASEFEDYKGLILAQMEARAAVDDWIMREPIGIRNLAPIRSHISDLLVTTENHGVLVFPDDPRWIVLQYQETIETSVRLRCLISTLIDIAGEILDSFVEDTADLARELDFLPLDVAEKRITTSREKLLPVIHFDTMAHMNIELIRGTLTSNYRDHAELMRAVLDDLNIDRMVNYLERRLGILSHHQTLFSDIASSVVERREKEQARLEEEMENRRTQAMEFVELFISVLAIGEVLGILFDALRAIEIVVEPIIESLTYFVGIGTMFLLIIYIRRSGRFEETAS